MNDYPLSAYREAAKTTIGGTLSFLFGLVGGSIIVFAELLQKPGAWPWFLVAWIVLVPTTIAKLWGLLLAPFLGIMLYGLIWREWNRLISASAIALAFAVIVWLSHGFNPFAELDRVLYRGMFGLFACLLLAGILWEWLRYRLATRTSS